MLHSNPSPHSTEASSPRNVSVPPLNSSGAHLPAAVFDLKDLALLHHWSLITSLSILSTEKINHVWQISFPDVAFRHHYVMHSILSLTALHVAYLDPSKRRPYLLEAEQHHSKALHGFKEDIGNIGPGNSDAIFATSVLTFFYAFLMFGKLYDSYGNDADGSARTSRVLGTNWIPLIRGVEAVLHPIYDHVKAGPLASVLDLGNWEELDPDKTSFDCYDEQLTQIRRIWDQGDNAETYNQTLYLLRKCRLWIKQFKVLQTDDQSGWGYNREWSAPFIWLLSAPQQYFVLLEQRQPPALIIFAWFGASIHILDPRWWLEGCGKSIVNVVDECLGQYWAPWTAWPKQIVAEAGEILPDRRVATPS